MEDQAEVLSPNASIGDEVKLFINYINSLNSMLPVTMSSMTKAQLEIYQESRDYARKYLEISKSKGNQYFVKVTIEAHKQIIKNHGRIDQAIIAYKLVLRSFVISLISQYDSFLGRLIRTLFLIHPDCLNISEKN